MRHRRQIRSQILLPVILAALLVIAACTWITMTAVQGTGDVSHWGSVAAIWVVIPVMAAVLIFAVVLAALVFLLSRLLGVLPVYTGKAQDLFYRLESLARKLTNMLVKPVFGIQEIRATLRALVGRR
jgi:hypothetical protein